MPVFEKDCHDIRISTKTGPICFHIICHNQIKVFSGEPFLRA